MRCPFSNVHFVSLIVKPGLGRKQNVKVIKLHSFVSTWQYVNMRKLQEWMGPGEWLSHGRCERNLYDVIQIMATRQCPIASQTELAQVRTCLAYAYGDLLGKDGVWACTLTALGHEANDTVEAAQITGALRANRGLCCSCSTVRVAWKQNESSHFRGALVVEYTFTRSAAAAATTVTTTTIAAATIVVSVAVSELKKWRPEEKRTKPKANTKDFLQFLHLFETKTNPP